MEETELNKLLNKQTELEPKVKTPEELQQEEDQKEFDFIMKELPFEPLSMATAAKKQFDRRLPQFLSSTEKSIRNGAALGALRWELKSVPGQPAFKHEVINYLRNKGFDVSDEGESFVVELDPKWYVNRG